MTARPDPVQWRNDELMTLVEAVALLWPHGPLTETSLRTAARDGRLPISRIAGKVFVTMAALKVLTVCEVICAPPTATVVAQKRLSP